MKLLRRPFWGGLTRDCRIADAARVRHDRAVDVLDGLVQAPALDGHGVELSPEQTHEPDVILREAEGLALTTVDADDFPWQLEASPADQ